MYPKNLGKNLPKMTVEAALIRQSEISPPQNGASLERRVSAYFTTAVESLKEARELVYGLPRDVDPDNKNKRKKQGIANFNEWIKELEDLNRNIQSKIVGNHDPDEIGVLFDMRVEHLETQRAKVDKWRGPNVNDGPPRGQEQERQFLNERIKFLSSSRKKLMPSIQAQLQQAAKTA